MATRIALQSLALARMQEAKVLHDNGLYDGAAYLAGYVLELALKARICKVLNDDYPSGRGDYASFMTHKFPILLRLAGLSKEFDTKKTTDTVFATNWSILANWSETWRYEPLHKTEQASADLIDALENSIHGLLTWLKNEW